MAAAQTGSTHGIAVMRRAPYLIPARSHSGNVAVQGLALRDLLDILSSDHVPLALLHAALTLNGLWGDLGGDGDLCTCADKRAGGPGRLQPRLSAQVIRLARLTKVAALRGVRVAGRRVG